jgi:hypothetical protein
MRRGAQMEEGSDHELVRAKLGVSIYEVDRDVLIKVHASSP